MDGSMFLAIAGASGELGFNSTYVTFVLYLVLLIGIGLFFSRRNHNLEDYLLGGRGMGSWVTALSAQASDMSSWLLMGLPGALFMSGLGQSWIAIGLGVGTLLNWLIVAPRLRNYTAKTGALTLPTFFKRRFAEPYNLLSMVSTFLTLLFFTIYTASGLKGTGLLFETTFGLPYYSAVLLGAGVMVFYTLLGGFMAVCWTDLFQGLLMFLAIVILPIAAFCSLEPGEFSAAIEAKNISLSLFKSNSTTAMGFLAMVSAAAWGLGYFGQPHILARFMSIKSIKILPRTITIAMIWVVVSLAGALAVGMLAIPMFPDIAAKTEAEKVFMLMIEQLMPGVLAGVFLAAIMAAAMSTIDSQLLVSSSSLTEDVYVRMLRPQAKAKEQLWVSRSCVMLIAVLACMLAWNKESTIFGLVEIAWSGFGAVFGPVVLMALYSRKTGWVGALSGMITGAAVWLIWIISGLSASLYEIVPAFIANIAVIMLCNIVFPNKQDGVAKMFDFVVESVKNKEDIR